MLTESEIEKAALLLCNSSLGNDKWNEQTDNHKEGFRKVVMGLWETLNVPRSPAAVKVFMVWMGEENA